MTRILVTGSRELTDRDLVGIALAIQVGDNEAPMIVVGDCPTGADLFAREWFDSFTPDIWPYSMGLEVFEADWDTHGKAAGPLRNQAMVDSGADVCLAFIKDGAGNRGTLDCVRRARAAHVEIKMHVEATP